MANGIEIDLIDEKKEGVSLFSGLYEKIGKVVDNKKWIIEKLTAGLSEWEGAEYQYRKEILRVDCHAEGSAIRGIIGSIPKVVKMLIKEFESKDGLSAQILFTTLTTISVLEKFIKEMSDVLDDTGIEAFSILYFEYFLPVRLFVYECFK